MILRTRSQAELDLESKRYMAIEERFLSDWSLELRGAARGAVLGTNG
jgi:hypothetical protein